MKKIYILVAGFLLCTGLVSCEMKDELLGDNQVSTETGLVELGVWVENKLNVAVSRGEAESGGIGQDTDVDPSDFPVVFQMKDKEYTENYTYKEIEGKTIQLPIGTYTISSHTPGELKTEMDYAYYAGDDEISVSSVTQIAKVKCTMQNSRIVLNFPADFQTAFSDWTVTLNDGSYVLEYTREDNGVSPDAVYWKIADDCKEIIIDIRATNSEGKTVIESRTIEKPAEASDKNWVGGDALTITMEPGAAPEDPEEPTGVSGITIKVDAFFENEEKDTVEVPVEDEEVPTEPSEPDGGDEGDGETTEPGEDGGETSDAPTLSGEYLNKVCNYDKTSTEPFPELSISMDVPNGIRDVKVVATTDNTIFESALKEMELTGEGVSLINNETLGKIFTLPTQGATSYDFVLSSNIGTMLKGFVGNHTFRVEVIDEKGKSASGTLSFSITNSK